MRANQVTLDYSSYGYLKSKSIYKISYDKYNLLNTNEADIYSERKINHSITNLTDSSQACLPKNILEVIQQTQDGKLGSTEVSPSQVW